MEMAMNLRRLTLNFLFFTISVVGVVSFPHKVTAFDNYKEFKKDHLEIELGMQQFYSEANYWNFGSSTTNLLPNHYYKLIDGNFGARYVMDELGLFVQGTYSSAESKDGYLTRTNASLSQVILGVDFLFWDSFIQVIPEIGLLIPLTTVSYTADKVLNAEGVYEGWGRVTIQKEIGRFRGYAWGGFDYRSDSRSYLAPWGGGLSVRLGVFKFGAEIFGAQSVYNDANADYYNKQARLGVINYLDGGSYKFYYPNPSIVDSLAYVNWNITSGLMLQVNGGMTLAGENAAAGSHIGVVLRYNFDVVALVNHDKFMNPAPKASPQFRPVQPQISTENKSSNFKEETTDGVDQSLFKPRPTPKTKPVDQDIQNQLDNTEYQIELRQKGK